MPGEPGSRETEPISRDQLTTPQTSTPTPTWVVLAFVVAVVFGVVARLIWVSDMEWKADEKYSVDTSIKILQSGDWPATGMSTSVGLPNPGLSVWAFTPFVAMDSDPTSVCRGVMILNVVALLGFAAMALRSPDSPNGESGFRVSVRSLTGREAWLWGIALFAVNPYCVRIARKIWPPSLLGVLVLMLWFGRSRRATRLGAFTWGLAGATMGQIHLSGYFLAGGIFAFSVLEQARGLEPRKTRWLWWLVGSAIGAVGLVSFLLASKSGSGKAPELSWTLDSFRLRILLFSEYAFDIALGLTAWATYAREYEGYLSSPTLLGIPTWMVGSLQSIALGIGLLALATWTAERMFASVPERSQRSIRIGVVRLRKRWLGRLDFKQRSLALRAWKSVTRFVFPRAVGTIGTDSEARFLARATFWGGGVLLILACRIIHLHYLFIFTPFLFVGLALVMERRRRMLAVLVLAQAILTFATLVDLHNNGGAPTGDYRASYRARER